MKHKKNATIVSFISIVCLTAVLLFIQNPVSFGQETQIPFGPQPATEEKTSDSDKEVVQQKEVLPTDNTIMVTKIDFKGVQSLRKEMLQTLIQTKVGQEIDEELLTKDLESLYKDTGFFYDMLVDVSRNEDDGGLAVTYILHESPKIEGINVIGNDEIDIGKIMDRITLRRSEIYNDHLRWQSQRAIRKLYHEKGYYLVSIQVHNDVNEEGNNSQVTFEIEEGPRVRIKEINFIGNQQLSAKKLRKKMKTRVGKHYDELLFEEEDMNLSLRNYYQDQGFAQVKVIGHEKRFTDDKTGLILDITVDEGAQFVLGNYNIELQTGEKVIFSKDKVKNMLDPAEGEVFNRAIFEESIAKLQQAYLDKGYLLAEVNPIPLFNEEDALVDITLNINQGDVIIIDNVPITGLEKTKERIIRRELDWLNIKSDELLDVKVLRKARQRLFQMGPFIRAVDFVPSDTENDSRKSLVVNIAESPTTGTLSVGGGYGSEGGIFGTAEIGQHNLFGRAYRVHLKGELGTKDHHTAEFSFGSPWIFGTPTRLNTRLYNNRRFRRYYRTAGAALNPDFTTDRYVWDTRGGSISLGRPIAYDIDLSVRFRNENIRAHTPDSEVLNRSTRSILFAVGRDTRDYRTSLYDPMGGSSNSLSYEYSGGFLGADNEFQKYTADTSWFFNPWWNHVFAIHARAGYMVSKSTDSRDLFYERFYLGGVDTIRGYEDWEIYPDSDNPLREFGGNKVFFSNWEYRVQVSPQLTTVAFFDIGQVWDESMPNVFNNINLKRGAGVEARLQMLGMLARFGWGYGFDRQNREPQGKFYFTIGPGF